MVLAKGAVVGTRRSCCGVLKFFCPIYAAVGLRFRVLCSGSYASQLIQRWCSRTASFRATATMAQRGSVDQPNCHDRGKAGIRRLGNLSSDPIGAPENRFASHPTTIAKAIGYANVGIALGRGIDRANQGFPLLQAQWAEDAPSRMLRGAYPRPPHPTYETADLAMIRQGI